MWPFRSKRHLRYDSIEAWIEGEKIPTPVTELTDARQRDRVFTQLAELRQHLFWRHVRELPEPEQTLVAAGRHPSQSHRFETEALPYAESLQEHLLGIGVPILSVRLGLYHCDRIVLIVRLASDADPKTARYKVPYLYRGFETKIGIAKPASTHAT